MSVCVCVCVCVCERERERERVPVKWERQTTLEEEWEELNQGPLGLGRKEIATFYFLPQSSPLSL